MCLGRTTTPIAETGGYMIVDPTKTKSNGVRYCACDGDVPMRTLGDTTAISTYDGTVVETQGGIASIFLARVPKRKDTL